MSKMSVKNGKGGRRGEGGEARKRMRVEQDSGGWAPGRAVLLHGTRGEGHGRGHRERDDLVQPNRKALRTELNNCPVPL